MKIYAHIRNKIGTDIYFGRERERKDRTVGEKGEQRTTWQGRRSEEREAQEYILLVDLRHQLFLLLVLIPVTNLFIALPFPTTLHLNDAANKGHSTISGKRPKKLAAPLPRASNATTDNINGASALRIRRRRRQ